MTQTISRPLASGGNRGRNQGSSRLRAAARLLTDQPHYFDAPFIARHDAEATADQTAQSHAASSSSCSCASGRPVCRSVRSRAARAQASIATLSQRRSAHDPERAPQLSHAHRGVFALTRQPASSTSPCLASSSSSGVGSPLITGRTSSDRHEAQRGWGRRNESLTMHLRIDAIISGVSSRFGSAICI